MDIATHPGLHPGDVPAPGRARRRAVTLSLTLDDGALTRALGVLERTLRAIDPRALVRVVDPVHELPWTELSFVAVDVETTGFVPGTDRVIEVAWVRFERGRENERFSSLLRLPADVDVPAAVRRVTGIQPAMLAGRPAFSEVAPGLLDALAHSDFAVAYNARFDRSFLAAELQRMNAVLPEVPWVDPLVFVRDLESTRGDGRLPKGLADVARRFGVALPNAHRAESDARATGELLLRLAPRLRAHTLADLVDTEARWARLYPRRHGDHPQSAGDEGGFAARLLSLFR